MPYMDYFILKTNDITGGHWNGRPDFNFNLKVMVSLYCYFNEWRLTTGLLFRKKC